MARVAARPAADSLEQWLELEYRYAATAMLMSVSPCTIVKHRRGFGQSVRPVAGAVVASPVPAAYDPEPDYFFHWFRDSALIAGALRVLFESRALAAEALTHFGDFVRFSRALQALDGRRLAADPAWREGVAADFARYVRDDAELAAVHGEAVGADTRVNPDGTLDISKWARPQHDGPPLRALAVLGWLQHAPLDPRVSAAAAALVRDDLAFTLHRWAQPSFDLWEEDTSPSYYTLRVSAAALAAGAGWLADAGDEDRAAAYRAESETILGRLDQFWLESEGHYRSRLPASGARTPKDLDSSVILAALHGDGAERRHSVHDPRMQQTLARLEALFAGAYPINRDRPSAPALGRYAGDIYYAGGPWYLATLAAAEFCFRAAIGAADAHAWIRRGDGFLATVRAFTPASGELSEQFDPHTGAQCSARHLAWSYAAFITCVAARRAALTP